jgi:hypothetical protein
MKLVWMFRGQNQNIFLVDNSIQMEMSLIGEPHVVKNTLFMSCSSGKMHPPFFVMISRRMHHSNLVQKRADTGA